MVPFLSMIPSWTGVTEVEEAPMSTTRAEALPAEKLVVPIGFVWEAEGGVERCLR